MDETTPEEMDNGKASPRDNVFFEDLQRCAKSKWLTDGTDHNGNNNPSMWHDNVLTVLFYCLSAHITLKVSSYFLRKKTCVYVHVESLVGDNVRCVYK